MKQLVCPYDNYVLMQSFAMFMFTFKPRGINLSDLDIALRDLNKVFKDKEQLDKNIVEYHKIKPEELTDESYPKYLKEYKYHMFMKSIYLIQKHGLSEVESWALMFHFLNNKA